VGGTTLTLVVLPLFAQAFYDNWFKAHLPVLESVFSYRWTPAIVTGVGLLIILLLLLWPNLVRPASTAAGQTRLLFYQRTTYIINGPVYMTESGDIVERAADKAPEDDVPDGPLGDATE
jgi:hypothetical protein